MKHRRGLGTALVVLLPALASATLLVRIVRYRRRSA